MARYSSQEAELTCLRHVPRFDHRVLSFERSGLVHKPPRLELSLLQRRDYSRALMAYVSVSQRADVAQCTKRFWGDISPYLTGNVHMASSSPVERRCRLLFSHLLKLPFENACLLLFHFFHSHESFVPFSNSLHLLPKPGKSLCPQLLLEPRYFFLTWTVPTRPRALNKVKVKVKHMAGPTKGGSKEESQSWPIWASPDSGVDVTIPRYPRVGKTVEGTIQ